MSELILERKGACAVATLNRPQAMNALSASLRRAIASAMAELDADPAVRAIILTGAGERAFCAGLDLKELEMDSSALGAAEAQSPELNPVLAVERCAKPVIGAINGVAITGGFELALACDILIGSTKARFADTHARVGLLPGWGLSQKLSRIVGLPRAKEASFSGNFIDASTALAWGLINRIAEPGDLLPATLALAAQMAEIEPALLQSYKALIDDGYALAYGDAIELERNRSLAHNAKAPQADFAQCRAEVQSRGRRQRGETL